MPRRKKRCASDAGCFPCNVPSECSFTVESWQYEVAKQKCGSGFGVSGDVQPKYASAIVSISINHTENAVPSSEFGDCDEAFCYCPQVETASIFQTVTAGARIVDIGTSCPGNDCDATVATLNWDNGKREEVEGGGGTPPCSPDNKILTYECQSSWEWVLGGPGTRTSGGGPGDIAGTLGLGDGRTIRGSAACGPDAYELVLDTDTQKKWHYEHHQEYTLESGCSACIIASCNWKVDVVGDWDVLFEDEILTDELIAFCEHCESSECGGTNRYTVHSFDNVADACFYLSPDEVQMRWKSGLLKVTNTSGIGIVVLWQREEWPGSSGCFSSEDPAISYGETSLAPGGSHCFHVNVDPEGENRIARLTILGCSPA